MLSQYERRHLAAIESELTEESTLVRLASKVDADGRGPIRRRCHRLVARFRRPRKRREG